ncbi:MAG: ubiquitin-conjugating enzyme E2 [Amphiamblys sp. WSBS2006]|nr:MAG: ubiquitin-conjugating enzyme E2 [Amphiamblys sp. WSBS2006]
MKHTGIVLLFAELSVSCIPKTTVLKRINKEIKNIQKEPASLVSITMFGEEKQASSISIVQAEENNLLKWKATMKGPEGTPFEGGIFEIDFTIPEDYPFSPPAIRFRSEMFHPNIYGDGDICLDILKDKWSPAQTLLTALLSIQSLLTDPNLGSQTNSEAGKLFSTDKTEYARRVRNLFGRINPRLGAASGPSSSSRDGNQA